MYGEMREVAAHCNQPQFDTTTWQDTEHPERRAGHHPAALLMHSVASGHLNIEKETLLELQVWGGRQRWRQQRRLPPCQCVRGQKGRE